jgi:hypothetical protein
MWNVDNPTLPQHREQAYCIAGQDKLRRAGVLLHKIYPKLTGMISFAQKHVPVHFHTNINHAWDGIGEWVA